MKRIAIPSVNNQLCMHFGHCEAFLLFEVDEQNQSIIKQEALASPPHQPGLLPKWIKEQGVDLVLAGGMGGRAVQLFQQDGIEVITGISETEPEKIVTAYLTGSLQTGANTCDH